MTLAAKAATLRGPMPFPSLPKSTRRRIAVVAALVVAAIAGVVWEWPEIEARLYPAAATVATPKLACEEVQARTLYFNSLALPWLAKLRPELLTAEDRDAGSSRSRAFVQAPQNPKLFRQLDRQHHFDTLLLIGEPSNYRRLLDHLLEPEPEKRDFRLVYLDHWGFIFKRGAAREWVPADADAVRQRLGKVRAREQATFLAMAAGRMLAVRHVDAAKRWLDEAGALDSRSIDVLAGLAGYQIQIGRWVEAETYADKALKKDPDSVPALAAKIVAMRATRHHIDALKLSVKLNSLLPEDPVRLWQHAQLAHEAKQNAIEIKALTRLIVLAREEGRPSAEYEFFLGEAHAHEALDNAEHAPLALEHLRLAVADPLLPAEKRKFAEERIALIRKRTGLK
jgi:tetratricopeptide (TPR) repeat protein